jgi:hypothetical protein
MSTRAAEPWVKVALDPTLESVTLSQLQGLDKRKRRCRSSLRL